MKRNIAGPARSMEFMCDENKGPKVKDANISQFGILIGRLN